MTFSGHENDGWTLLVMHDPDGRRGVWCRPDPRFGKLDTFELSAGREGSDAHVRLALGETITEETLTDLAGVLSFAVMPKDRISKDPETGSVVVKQDVFWLRKIEALQPGDACEFRYPAQKAWLPGTVVKNGVAGYWHVQEVRDPNNILSLYIEHIRLPGQVEAWP